MKTHRREDFSDIERGVALDGSVALLAVDVVIVGLVHVRTGVDVAGVARRRRRRRRRHGRR